MISYSSEPLNVKDQRDQYGRTVGEMHTENRIRTMRKELEELRLKVHNKRETFTKLSKQFVPVAQQFEVNTKFYLDPEEAAYMIQIELPMSIDTIALSSSVHVDLLDQETNSNAVVSRSPPDAANKNALLATYRCQETASRVEMKLRTTEGESGDITATVIAKTNPKVAQVIKLQVKSLSLHHRIHVFEEEESERKLNVLKITGTFSQQVMHDWISAACQITSPSAGHCHAPLPQRVHGLGAQVRVLQGRGDHLVRLGHDHRHPEGAHQPGGGAAPHHPERHVPGAFAGAASIGGESFGERD